MSHFLARLVERARGTAPRVEPIISPRFAPAPILEITTEVEAPAPARSRDRQSTSQNEASVPKIVRPTVEPSRGDEIRREEVAAAPELEQLLVPQETHLSTSPPSIVRRASSEEIAARPKTNGARSEQSRHEASAPWPGSPIPATTQASRKPAARIRDPGHPGAMRATQPPARLQPNESDIEPPIVRVTIGRIEVRAETPASAPRKTASASKPTLSLDAYLKQRKEGRR